MEIILSGGGSGKQTFEMDEKFAELVDKSKPLLYIPIAMDVSRHSYDDCLNWLKSTFEKFGINKYDMLREDNVNNFLEKKPECFGGLYIGGGNTPYLLKTLKESGIWEWIESASDKIPIYGGSAGAIIFAKTIIPSLSADKNEVGLKDFSAMNLIKDFEIWCHYNENIDKIIYNFFERYNLKKIIAIPEETAIYVSDDNLEIIGQKSAYLFEMNNKKEIKVGEKL